MRCTKYFVQEAGREESGYVLCDNPIGYDIGAEVACGHIM